MRTSINHTVAAIGLLMASQLAFAAVNINKADANTIARELIGVGKARAEAIVKERQKNGPFKNGKDLASRVKGIGAGIIAKNKDKLRFK